ncbi:hypothetical protein LSH36_305g02020 [Paralvinella palmiformis]|uniref:Uncharacterized protein n=1 Tax=Paralvinella palmiformis TaxID=53620 RepID=A0AAD9N102_9ANNE|nr:hypothetical protein LSH36_305g02020 [Paralvinella palmiformis]
MHFSDLIDLLDLIDLIELVDFIDLVDLIDLEDLKDLVKYSSPENVSPNTMTTFIRCHILLALAILAIYGCEATVVTSLTFEPATILPINVNAVYVDDVISCTMFNVTNPNDHIYTLARFEIESHTQTRVNLTICGRTLKSGVTFLMAGLTLAEAERWTGRWPICSWVAEKKINTVDCMYYDCPCPPSCRVMQVLRIPENDSARWWQLCKLEYEFFGRCRLLPIALFNSDCLSFIVFTTTS